MVYISQESLNFSLSEKILTFQRNKVLIFTENIQVGRQYYYNYNQRRSFTDFIDIFQLYTV